MRASKVEGHVDAFVKNHRKAIGKYALSPDDWDSLREINVFLKPFEKITMATQGDNDSIDKTLVTMDILVRHFAIEKQKNKHLNDAQFRDAIMRAWYAFDKYYSLTDEAAALLSVVNDPILRLYILSYCLSSQFQYWIAILTYFLAHD